MGWLYVGLLVVSSSFLKCNCFSMVSTRRVVHFSTRWCVETGGVGTKLGPKTWNSVSIGDS